MPRKSNRNVRRKLKCLGDESVNQTLSSWNQRLNYTGRRWGKASPDEDLTALEHRIMVAAPTSNSFVPQKRRACHGRRFPAYEVGRKCQTDCEELIRHPEKKNGSLPLQQRSKASILTNKEFREHLLRAIEEAKRRMDEWVDGEIQQAYISDRKASLDDTMMDWQSERTVVIPQTVSIHYPWDAVDDGGVGGWWRWGGRSTISGGEKV